MAMRRGKAGASKKNRGRKRVSQGGKRFRHLDGVKQIDVKDHEFLRKFVTDHGKIIPSRLTGASAKQQRQIKQGVRRARTMGLLP